MIETEKLETILDRNNIILEFSPLSQSVLGYYFSDGNFHIILINKQIRNDERLYRTVLAEEIGHYETTVGDITPRRELTYSERYEIYNRCHGNNSVEPFLLHYKSTASLHHPIYSFKLSLSLFIIHESFSLGQLPYQLIPFQYFYISLFTYVKKLHYFNLRPVFLCFDSGGVLY